MLASLIPHIFRGAVAVSATLPFMARREVQPRVTGHVEFQEAHPWQMPESSPSSGRTALHAESSLSPSTSFKALISSDAKTPMSVLLSHAPGLPAMAPFGILADALVARIVPNVKMARVGTQSLPSLGPYEGELRGATVLVGEPPPARERKETYLADDSANKPTFTGRPSSLGSIKPHEGLVPAPLPQELNVHLSQDGGFDIKHTIELPSGAEEKLNIRNPKWNTVAHGSTTDPEAVNVAQRLLRTVVVHGEHGSELLGQVLARAKTTGISLTQEAAVIAALERARREASVSIDWSVMGLLDSYLGKDQYGYARSYHEALTALNKKYNSGDFMDVYLRPDGASVFKVLRPDLYSDIPNFVVTTAQRDQIVQELANSTNQMSDYSGPNVVTPAEHVAQQVIAQKYLDGWTPWDFPPGSADLATALRITDTHINDGRMYLDLRAPNNDRQGKTLSGNLKGWVLSIDGKHHNFLLEVKKNPTLQGWIDPFKIKPPELSKVE